MTVQGPPGAGPGPGEVVRWGRGPVPEAKPDAPASTGWARVLALVVLVAVVVLVVLVS